VNWRTRVWDSCGSFTVSEPRRLACRRFVATTSPTLLLLHRSLSAQQRPVFHQLTLTAFALSPMHLYRFVSPLRCPPGRQVFRLYGLRLAFSHYCTLCLQFITKLSRSFCLENGFRRFSRFYRSQLITTLQTVLYSSLLCKYHACYMRLPRAGCRTASTEPSVCSWLKRALISTADRSGRAV
jgi:hypothetical protein